MDYKIVVAHDAKELVRLLLEEAKYGWRPCGGVSVSQIPNGTAIYVLLMEKELE